MIDFATMKGLRLFGGLRGSGPLIGQRIVTSWRLLAVLAFGMLVAATLLAASPVYTRVMNDLGLETALRQRLGRETRNTGIQINMPFGSERAAREAAFVTSVVSEELGWFTRSHVSYGSIVVFDYTREGEAVVNDPLRPLIQLQTASGFDDRVRVLEGRLARPTSNASEIEVMVPAESARSFKVKPGDRIVASRTLDDCTRLPPTNDPAEIASRAQNRCVPGIILTLSVTMTVAGIIEQADTTDAYWAATRVSFSTPIETEDQGPILQTVLPEESYYRALPKALPNVPSQWELSSFADLSKIDSSKLDRVRQSIATMRQRLEQHGALADTPMGFALADFSQRASFNQVTLLLLLLQVVGIAIYYVLLVSSLLVERRSEEIAMMRSRGATVWQVTALAGAEALFLALIVALMAPFLASATVSLLGLTGTFTSVSGGGLLPFTLVPQSFLLGLAGALLAAVAVVIPAFFTARQGMVVFLRGNARPGKPFMQRYFVDVALVGLAALALWQVNQRGSVFDPESVGGWSADPLLLLSPLLVIVAVGLMMFRFLPPLLGLASKLVAATAGSAAMTLGLWQMTRSPARYTQLALLVVMAAAVGTFAATYGATTERSQEERALFEAGVDLRIDRLGRLERYDMERVAAELGGIPGVEAVSGVFRSRANLGPLSTGGRELRVLGIDPAVAAGQLWFRDDFAAEPLSTLLSRIEGAPDADSTIDLGRAVALSVWVNPTLPRANTTLWVRTVDAAGIWRLNELGRLDYSGYTKLTASFASEYQDIAFPLQLAGFMMTQPAVQDLSRGEVFFDDVSVVEPGGAERIVEDFEGAFRWDLLRTPTRNRDSLDQGRSGGAYRGQGAARYVFLAGQTTALRGIHVTSPNLPLPAIASRSFLNGTGLRVGGEAEIVFGNILMPVTILGVVDYFPTMDDGPDGFVIVNANHIMRYASLTMQTANIRPNEAWLTVSSDPAVRSAVYTRLQNDYGIPARDTVDVQELLTGISNDPVVRAGGSGVLLIALVAAFAILALGFGLTLYLGGQARSLEVSVLRAVGLSPRQVFAMICLEYLLIAVIGLVVGTLAGLRISATMLDFLNVTETGARLLPPFMLSTRWDTVAIAVVATGIAFIVGITALAGYFLRLPVSRVLRLTR